MGYLDWLPEYELGHPTIDGQHRKWFQLTNVFLKKAYAGEAGSAAVQKALAEMVAYARYHFTEEEDFMRSIKFPSDRMSAHIAIHDSFVERINQLARLCRDGHSETVQEMLQFLTEWLRQHILETDIKYIRFYRRVGPGIATVTEKRLRRTASRRRLRG